MKPKTKITLIIVGGVVLLASMYFGVFPLILDAVLEMVKSK